LRERARTDITPLTPKSGVERGGRYVEWRARAAEGERGEGKIYKRGRVKEGGG
jgi:hypothetical protein